MRNWTKKGCQENTGKQITQNIKEAITGKINLNLERTKKKILKSLRINPAAKSFIIIYLLLCFSTSVSCYWNFEKYFLKRKWSVGHPLYEFHAHPSRSRGSNNTTVCQLNALSVVLCFDGCEAWRPFSRLMNTHSSRKCDHGHSATSTHTDRKRHN